METQAESPFWEKLLRLIEEHRVVPVVGRELLTVRHQDSEVPLYSLIAKRLADHLGVSGADLQVGDEIDTVACRYLEKGNRIEDIYPALKTVMPAASELPTPEPLTKLVSILPFSLFLTTTFDSLVEEAINQERFAGQPKTRVLSYAPNAVKDLPATMEESDPPTVFHLFGRLSAMPTYAATGEDSLEFLHSLQSENGQPQLLLDELSRANLLLLGCNFDHWFARFFLRTLRRQRLSETRGPTDYVADGRTNGNDNLVLFLKNFTACTNVYENGRAADFIDELHLRWTARHANGAIGPGYGELGAVFLSYATEDTSAASKIKNGLEAEGVDVFFDKDKLWASDDFEANLKLRISESALFIPVISRNTLTGKRRFFRAEWNQAVSGALKTESAERLIVPVVIDDTSPADPAIPQRFRDLYWGQLPEGQTNPEFISMVKRQYRRYQKIVVGRA